MPSTETASTQLDERDRDRDRERDQDRGDRGDRADRGERGERGSKQKASAASKAKDLSHVPCKFFKVGGCTAGASCPFSHSLSEPGGQKETCTWFVKGNCKFGHKCALAHILPGQPMAMDRKNKKAAQVAAAAAAGGGNNNPGVGRERDGNKAPRGKRDAQAGAGPAAGSATATRSNALFAGGSTAPTRAVHPASSRPPITMPLKATISPSAPAPSLNDTDFASFGVLDESTQPSLPPAQGKNVVVSSDATSANKPSPSTAGPAAPLPPASANINSIGTPAKPPSPQPLPVSAPRNANHTPQADYGPIGSPPTSSQLNHNRSPSRVNGSSGHFSPGTSPLSHAHANSASINGVSMAIASSPSRSGLSNAGTTPNTNTNFLSTSPFSAPGTQSMFMAYNEGGMRGGMAASLGSGLAMGGGRRGWGNGGNNGGTNEYGGSGQTPVSSSFHARISSMGGRGGGDYNDISFEYDDYRSQRAPGSRGNGKDQEVAVEDEDLEDFLPSSLTDLLTPEERSRRMSRSNSGQGPGVVVEGGRHISTGAGQAAGTGSGLGHRYSRSVPAPSLLGDIKSIWADTSAHPLPNHTASPSASFTSNGGSGFGGRAGYDGANMSLGEDLAGGGVAGSIENRSMSMMGPSNASAAFLPGLQHHYLNSKAKQQQQGLGLGIGGRGGRNISSPLYAGGNSGAAGRTSTLANSYLQGGGFVSGGGTPPTSQFSNSYRPNNPFDLTLNALHNPAHPDHFTTTNAAQGPNAMAQNTRPIPSTPNPPGVAAQGVVLSPSTRALQSHAPGQSLPQGLAAGYSRIHALPPLPHIASPGTPGAFTGTSPGIGGGHMYGGGEWGSGTSPTPNNNAFNNGMHMGNNVTGGAPPGQGLESMFSRLSYSAAAARVPGSANPNPTMVNAGPIPNPAHGPPPGLQRNSDRKYPTHLPQQGIASPLSGPVVSRDDDDDLFDMDG